MCGNYLTFLCTSYTCIIMNMSFVSFTAETSYKNSPAAFRTPQCVRALVVVNKSAEHFDSCSTDRSSQAYYAPHNNQIL